jgi:hypothetical protein
LPEAQSLAVVSTGQTKVASARRQVADQMSYPSSLQRRLFYSFFLKPK